MEKDNPANILSLLIKALHIPITRNTISEEFQKHPNPNSLLAMSDLLNYWNVPNAAYELTFEELIRAGITPPFITRTKKDGFALIHELAEQSATISSSKYHERKINIDEFKQLYAGCILIAEKDDTSGEVDYNKKCRAELIREIRIPTVVGGAITVLILALVFHTRYFIEFTWQTALLSLFKTTGVITATLLLVQSIDSNNSLIQKLCGTGGGNCNAILSSKAAKVTDELSWSEVGFFYFTGSWLTFLFNSTDTPLLQMLAILNIVCLPYTFYSIYYQWRIAKQWCIFCCSIQALLWLEFFPFLSFLRHGLYLLSLADWATLIICFTLPVLVWVFIKPHLHNSKQLHPLQQHYWKLKYSTSLFDSLLNDQPVNDLLKNEDSLIMGDSNANTVVTMVSDPYCLPCADAHAFFDRWLPARQDITFQMVFLTKEDSQKIEVASHILNLRNDQDQATLKKAIREWYEHNHKGFKNWSLKYPTKDDQTVNHILKNQNEWCNMVEVEFTPSIFINGRRLPMLYSPDDIKYFI